MSATAKQQNGSDAATRELWRAAESGDTDDLVRIFSSGALINARNKHGVTALMKAATHGHARMVSALLQRGADPNLARNDKFTALALAAFFGHADTVKILVQHGARTEAVTRCGASAQTWATRRTFVEAARCLESHTPEPAPKPAPEPVITSVPAPVTKTLKDPPEIWDLVHEVPRGFNATSAFLSRLTSMKMSLAFRVAAVLLVGAACVIGMLVLRGSQAHTLPVAATSNRSVATTENSAPVNVENAKSETPADPSTPEVSEFSHHSESPSVSNKPRKLVLTPQSRSRELPEEEPVQSVGIVQSREVPPAPPAPVTANPQAEPRKSPNKVDAGLSPQLIAPAKSASPKAKVIQWP